MKLLFQRHTILRAIFTLAFYVCIIIFYYTLFLLFSETHNFEEHVYDVPLNYHGKTVYISKDLANARAFWVKTMLISFVIWFLIGLTIQVFGRIKMFPPLGLRNAKAEDRW